MGSSSFPQTIKAILQPDVQSNDLILTTQPMPTLPSNNTNQHLIRVHATSPCANELNWPKSFPAILDGGKALVPCNDLSGTVVSAPSGSPFPPGTEVYGRTTAWRTGNAREYTIAVEEEIAVAPKNLSHEEAASIALSAITAHQCLFEHGGLVPWTKPGYEEANKDKKVVVTAASGGCGMYIVQLARAAGVGSIVGTCGTKNIDFVKSLGATEVIDYHTSSLKEWVGGKEEKKADLVIDCRGGAALEDAWYAIKSHGTLLSIYEPTEPKKPSGLEDQEVKNYFFVMRPDGKQLAEITELIEGGKVEPVVDSVWDMDEFEKAFERVEGGHSKGKVVIKIGE